MKYLFFLKAGNYITCHVEIARELKSHTAALFLSELCEKYCFHRKNNELSNDERFGDDLFYYKAEDCEERTALSRKEQDTAIGILIKFGLISKFIMGLPAKRYFKLNHEKIEEFISEIQNKFSSLSVSDKLDSDKPVCPKGANCVDPNGQTAHIREEHQDDHEQQPIPRSARVVVPPSSLDKLELNEGMKTKLLKEFSHNQINLAVERTLNWKGRQSDAAAVISALTNASSWQDNPKSEDLPILNKKIALELKESVSDLGHAKTFEIYNDSVEILHPSGINPFILSYSEKGFKDQLESAMRKYSMKWKKE